MRTEIETLSLTAIVVCFAAGMSAAQVDWNRDPKPGFQKMMAEPVTAPPIPATVRQQEDGQAKGAEPLKAVSCDSKGGGDAPLEVCAQENGYAGGRLLVETRYPFEASLTLNHEKDRVGATASNCNPYPGVDGPIEACETVEFFFPQLRVDRQTKSIFSGEEKIGHYGRLGAGLEKGYRFETKVVREYKDNGWNHRAPYEHLEVSITKAARKGSENAIQ